MEACLTRFIRRDLEDASNDDQNSYEETQGLLNTLYINSIIFAVFMTFYEMNRHMRSIYLKRLTSKFKKSNRVPAAPSKYPFAWIVTVLRIGDDDLLRMVGLDGYMLVRYINVCFKMSLFLTLWGMLVLVPVYSTAQEKHFSWNKYTLANIPNDPSAHQLWIPAISAYIFATYFCHLMYGEYRNFVKKRIQYLVQGDPDTPPQTYYTLMVEKVPVNLRSAPALEAFFENLFPGDVHSVEVALDLKELDMMTRHRRHIRDSLEKAIALSKATGRHQLQWIRKDFYEHTSPLNVVKENRIASFLGFIVVDAVEHRTRVLAELNNLVRILQLATLERRHILDQQETRRQQGKMEAHVGKKVRNFFNAGMSTFLAERDKTVTAARGYFRKYQCNQRPDTDLELDTGCRFGPSRSSPFLRNRPFPPILTQEAPIATCLYAINDTKGCFNGSILQGNITVDRFCWQDSSQKIIRNKRERIRRVSNRTSGNGNPEDQNNVAEKDQVEESAIAADLVPNDTKLTSSTFDGTTVSSPLHPLHPVDPPNLGGDTERKKRRVPRIDRIKRSRWKVLWAIRSFIALIQVTGLAMFGVGTEALGVTCGGIRWLLRSLLEGVRTVELLTVGAYYKTSSTAFVTLKSRGAKSSAHQMFLSHVHYSMVVKSAPNPKDCIWENISIPARQIEMRKTIADCCFIVGAVFWSIVVGFITAVANFESLSKELPWLDAYRNTATYDILNQYLAVGVLLILLSLLPFLFDMIARSYEGRKLESEIQNSIMTRYFYYQLANVFVSVGLGSIANSIHQIIQNPSSVLSILGTSLPTLSVYFTNLLIVKSFTAVPLELLRIWPLICVLSVRSWRDKNKCTIRELKKGAFAYPPILYGWIYPNLLMVLMIISTYCCIAPMLVPFGLLYYSFAYLMYKYQLLFVYVNKYQSGGFMWYAVFNRSMVALIAGVLTLLGYLGIRETFFSGPFYLLAPLPFCITYFWYKCEDRFKTASMSLSLESAIHLDREAAQRTDADLSVPHHTFHPALFRQPSLAEGLLKPQPYRRVHSLSDPFGVVRAKTFNSNGNGKGDFSAMDSYDDQQKSETSYKDFDPRSLSKNTLKRDSTVTSPLRSRPFSFERVEDSSNLSTGKSLRITQKHMDSEKLNNVFPPKIQIPKGMGLNMCEYLEFNSSLSSADPTDMDYFYSDERYNPAHTRSRTNSREEVGEKEGEDGEGEEEEEEDRDSGDERDVNEILECNGHFDVINSSECVPEDMIVENIVSPLKSPTSTSGEYRFNIHADTSSRGEYATTQQDRNQRRIFTVPDLGIRISSD